MHHVFHLRYLAYASWLAIACACSSGDDEPSNAAAGAQSGASGSSGGEGGNNGGASGSSGGTGGSAGGSTPAVEGPAISTAPPEWARPGDCGGVGELCVGLGCGERSSCQLEGDVCIPALVPGARSLPGKDAEHPYCAAFTCMTFEEASCFCTGPAGETVSSCASPSALAGLCMGQGTSCAERACCDGLSCVEDGYNGMVCEQTCTTNDDCETGCCTDPRDTGDLICSDLSACENPCKKRGDACMGSETSNGGCCRGSCVESMNTDFAGCRPTCRTDTDCDTGCCEPFADSELGFCVEARYCMCGQMDAPCGGMNAQCCDGFECVGQTVETLACHKVCTANSECPDNCCAPVQGGEFMICEPPEYCP